MAIDISMTRCMILMTCIGFMACSGNRKVTALWESVPLGGKESVLEVLPSEYALYQLDIDQLKQALKNTGSQADEGIFVQFPDPAGTMQNFKVWSSGVVSEKLKAKYPDLNAYQGFNASEVSVKVRLEVPRSGLQVMVADGTNTWFIAPFDPAERLYLVFYKRDLSIENQFWEGRIE